MKKFYCLLLVVVVLLSLCSCNKSSSESNNSQQQTNSSENKAYTISEDSAKRKAEEALNQKIATDAEDGLTVKYNFTKTEKVDESFYRLYGNYIVYDPTGKIVKRGVQGTEYTKFLVTVDIKTGHAEPQYW